jgi:hypothetical protein
MRCTTLKFQGHPLVEKGEHQLGQPLFLRTGGPSQDLGRETYPDIDKGLRGSFPDRIGYKMPWLDLAPEVLHRAPSQPNSIATRAKQTRRVARLAAWNCFLCLDQGLLGAAVLLENWPIRSS